jgi:hypothetical protein
MTVAIVTTQVLPALPHDRHRRGDKDRLPLLPGLITSATTTQNKSDEASMTP